MAMAGSDFRHSLMVLGLGQYHDLFVSEAFDSWPVLAQITEQDLDTLNVRLGHRRILQRAIADYQQASNQPGGQPVRNTTEQSLVALAPCPTQDSAKRIPRVKRKYVRHPKDDENAPSPAPTGYVLFSNWVRETLKDQKHDFPEIAKIVGQKWQALPKVEKESFLNKSKELKAQYLQQLAEYKRTPQYRDYQRYLAHFRAKNTGIAHSHKRSRSPLGEHASIDGSSDAYRSRSESTAGEPRGGEWNVFDPQQTIATVAHAHNLPSMQLSEHSSPKVMEPAMSPTVMGAPQFDSLARLQSGMVYQHSPAGSDRCQQPTASHMSARQLPPLISSFR